MGLVSFSTLRLFVIFLFWMFAGRVFAAQVLPETQATAKQVWQVLDYLAVDYSKAVRDGKVVSADEYKEMQEFAGTVRHRLTELPESQQKAQLVSRWVSRRQLVKCGVAAGGKYEGSCCFMMGRARAG